MKLWIFLLLFIHGIAAKEEYSEELFATTLPNNELALVNRFIITASVNEPDYEFLYVPLTIRQLLGDNIEEFTLSMTNGFWKENLWGLEPQNDAPSGISLRAKFADLSDDIIDKTWSTLVKQVNGIFCSSILEMNPFFTTAPNFGKNISEAGNVRYGHLSGEPVCTENIYPFLRLLPCMKNGFATVIELDDLYLSPYYSLSIKVNRKRIDDIDKWKVELLSLYVKTRIDLTALNHLQRPLGNHVLTYSYEQLRCPIAKKQVILGTNVSSNATGEQLTSIDIASDSRPQGNYVSFKVHKPTLSKPAFSLHIGYEKADARGGILGSEIVNNLNVAKSADYVHVLPWQLHLELSSLDFVCISSDQAMKGTILDKSLTPSLIRDRPTSIYFKLLLPPRSKCTLKLSFSNHLMTALSYPPDSNYGIFIPGPILSVNIEEPIFKQMSNFLGSFWHNEEDSRNGTVGMNRSVILHGEPLLVFLPVPDFSMPFNVISIVTTAAGFLFGSIYNLSVKKLLPDFASEVKKPSRFAFLSKLRFWKK